MSMTVQELINELLQLEPDCSVSVVDMSSHGRPLHIKAVQTVQCGDVFLVSEIE